MCPGDAARSQQRWLREREYLNAHRHDLTRVVQDLYPAPRRVAGTQLLARPEWLPARPVPLEQVTLTWRPGPAGTVVDPVQPAGSEGVRPLRDDGTRFGSYADALAALSPPRLLENRTCYRLLEAGTPAAGVALTFGANRYFDVINVSEAVAHETAARVLARQHHGDGVAGRDAAGGPVAAAAWPAAAAPLSMRELTGPGATGREAGIEFSAANVARFTGTEAMQAAGAALLRLAWQHRGVLLGD